MYFIACRSIWSTLMPRAAAPTATSAAVGTCMAR